MIKSLIFDWGDTIMRDFPKHDGPAYLWENIAWIPNTENSLNILVKKYSCYIASNAGISNTNMMVKALDRMNASKYFKGYYTSIDLGFEKPDVRFFQAIINKINVQPDECVMIGNVYKKDIVGAKAAGMKTVFFNEKNLTGYFKEADFVINLMEELPGCLF